MFSSNTTQTSGKYQIQRSLRFNSADSAYLNRTPASATNRTTWTWSGWLKRSTLGANQAFFAGNSAATDSDYTAVSFLSDDTLSIGGWNTDWRKTTQVFRDVSAWYHIVVVWDTTQATAANRVKLYINNVEVTSFIISVNPSLNATSGVNTASPHYISTYNTVNQFFPGYMTEVNFIDGQALTPSSFGEINADTGVWQPKRYAGSYGTNGFYLNFSDNSNTTAATLGKDYSGNGNNWTPNNFSLTPGVTYDAMTDVPTLTSATAANFATLNPLVPPELSTTFSDGNLRFFGGGAVVGSMAMGAKTYAEMIPGSTTSVCIGVGPMVSGFRGGAGAGIQDSVVWFSSGSVFKDGGGTAVATYATFTTNDVCAFTFDPSNRQVTFYKNNVLQGSQTVSGTQAISFYGLGNTSASADVNFGQRPFAYTPPSGFVALNTFNLPSSTIPAGNKFMDATTYTGTGSSLSVTNSGSMQPDLVWIKSRSAATNNKLTDVVRGATKALITNTFGDETTDTQGLTAFGSAGFTVGTDTTYNNSGATYVGWQWKGGGAGITNTAGTITSTVSANATSGCSVIKYISNGVNGATVGHGLGVAPSLVIVKCTFATTTQAWAVYHSALGATKYLILQTTDAAATSSTYWNNTAPTSSVFTIGTSNDVNINGSVFTYAAYCFAPIAGFSAFGSYTGNGSSDGPFIYTGFRPRWVLVKDTTSSGNYWLLHDTSRSPFNLADKVLFPNLSDAEATQNGIDILSNGFKTRTSGSNHNANGNTYIYAAFAENPFKNALAR